MFGNATVTIIIIILNVAFSLAAFSNQQLFDKYKFNPYMIRHRNEWWRIFTGAFLHGDYMHLLFNMLTLYFFGPPVERQIFGNIFDDAAPYYYIGLYVGGIIFSHLYSLEKHKNDIWYSAVGASGAVSAVLFSVILFAPWIQLYVFFIPMPAIVFAILYLGYSIYMGRRGGDNIGHAAHVSGAVFGVIYTLIIYPKAGSLFIDQILSVF